MLFAAATPFTFFCDDKDLMIMYILLGENRFSL